MAGFRRSCLYSSSTLQGSFFLRILVLRKQKKLSCLSFFFFIFTGIYIIYNITYITTTVPGDTIDHWYWLSCWRLIKLGLQKMEIHAWSSGRRTTVFVIISSRNCRKLHFVCLGSRFRIFEYKNTIIKKLFRWNKKNKRGGGMWP